MKLYSWYSKNSSYFHNANNDKKQEIKQTLTINKAHTTKLSTIQSTSSICIKQETILNNQRTNNVNALANIHHA